MCVYKLEDLWMSAGTLAGAEQDCAQVELASGGEVTAEGPEGEHCEPVQQVIPL